MARLTGSVCSEASQGSAGRQVFSWMGCWRVLLWVTFHTGLGLGVC